MTVVIHRCPRDRRLRSLDIEVHAGSIKTWLRRKDGKYAGRAVRKETRGHSRR